MRSRPDTETMHDATDVPRRSPGAVRAGGHSLAIRTAPAPLPSVCPSEEVTGATPPALPDGLSLFGNANLPGVAHVPAQAFVLCLWLVIGAVVALTVCKFLGPE